MQGSPAESKNLPDLRHLRVVGASGRPTKGHPDCIQVVLCAPGGLETGQVIPMAVYRRVEEEAVRGVPAELLLELQP